MASRLPQRNGNLLPLQLEVASIGTEQPRSMACSMCPQGCPSWDPLQQKMQETVQYSGLLVTNAWLTGQPTAVAY